MTGNELDFIKDAHNLGQLSGDGLYTHKCTELLEQFLGAKKVVLTNSCTAALEMAALLIRVKPGDEIIMPSFTFVSTANAFCLRGGTPVFVDVSTSDLNINLDDVESSITNKTKAIVVVHYGGFSCNMERLSEICDKNGIFLIEDAAQALGSMFNGRMLGTFGALSCFSFHETKNVICGEGGALVINEESYIDRALIIREKGTDRTNFTNGLVDKYTWRDIGSSYLPGELNAAFLYAQLKSVNKISSMRLKLWYTYYEHLSSLKEIGIILRDKPSKNRGNGHLFYLILRSETMRNRFILEMKSKNINCVFHYLPLHLSEYGNKISKFNHLPVTEAFSKRLVRLPLWLDDLPVDRVIDSVKRVIKTIG
jgi:dTDP-4-amino-4,6-dideoxygalactose transaminase